MRVFFLTFHLNLNEDYRVGQHGRVGHGRRASRGDQVLTGHCISAVPCLAGGGYALVIIMACETMGFELFVNKEEEEEDNHHQLNFVRT
jgi:hypothetical protein